jgi:hypothetical protein
MQQKLYDNFDNKFNIDMSSKRDCENYILRLMRVIVTPIGVVGRRESILGNAYG